MEGLPRTRRKLVRKGVSTLGDYWYLMGGNITVQVLSMFMYMYVATVSLRAAVLMSSLLDCYIKFSESKLQAHFKV